jgi:AcrR family transcriptional regulator
MPTSDGITTRSRLLEAAGRVFASDSGASMAEVAAAAGVSRATVHRHFRTRVDLLAALELEPDPDSRARVLAAAGKLVTRDGLAALFMDELAALAGVSRATVYRLYPGKAALVEAMMDAYAPFDPIITRLEAIGDGPPEEVLPEICRSAASIAAANVGVLRAIFFEVTTGSPDALEGARRPVGGMIRTLGGYLERQMAAGRLRQMHPTLAVESLLAPLLFYVLTGPYAARVAGLDAPFEAAVDQLVDVTLRGLQPSPPGPGRVDSTR